MSEAKNEQSLLKSQVQIRTATEADVPFIFNSWLKSFKGSMRNVPTPIYYSAHHKVIERLLQQSQVLVACSVSDPTQLFGYLVHQNVQDLPVIHYVYVKHSIRKMGIMRLLLSEASIGTKGFYTHFTHVAPSLCKEFIHNPYLAYGVE